MTLFCTKPSQTLPEVEVYFPIPRVFNPHLINFHFNVQLLRRENNRNTLSWGKDQIEIYPGAIRDAYQHVFLSSLAA